MAFAEIDPITGKRKKSGGRKVGSINKTTVARHECMTRVNQALTAMGSDPLTGSKLLREVLNHPDTPLDVKITCAGMVLKQESPAASEQQHVCIMPWSVKDLDEWKQKYMEVAPNTDPTEMERLERVAKAGLEKAASRKDNPPWTDDQKETK